MVIPGHNLGNSQVSVNRTIGPTLVLVICQIKYLCIDVSVCGSVYDVEIVMSRVVRKPPFWFPTWSDTNQAIQSQKMARSLKFWI